MACWCNNVQVGCWHKKLLQEHSSPPSPSNQSCCLCPERSRLRDYQAPKDSCMHHIPSFGLPITSVSVCPCLSLSASVCICLYLSVSVYLGLPTATPLRKHNHTIATVATSPTQQREYEDGLQAAHREVPVTVSCIDRTISHFMLLFRSL